MAGDPPSFGYCWSDVYGYISIQEMNLHAKRIFNDIEYAFYAESADIDNIWDIYFS